MISIGVPDPLEEPFVDSYLGPNKNYQTWKSLYSAFTHGSSTDPQLHPNRELCTSWELPSSANTLSREHTKRAVYP